MGDGAFPKNVQDIVPILKYIKISLGTTKQIYIIWEREKPCG